MIAATSQHADPKYYLRPGEADFDCAPFLGGACRFAISAGIHARQAGLEGRSITITGESWIAS